MKVGMGMWGVGAGSGMSDLACSHRVLLGENAQHRVATRFGVLAPSCLMANVASLMPCIEGVAWKSSRLKRRGSRDRSETDALFQGSEAPWLLFASTFGWFLPRLLHEILDYDRELCRVSA